MRRSSNPRLALLLVLLMPVAAPGADARKKEAAVAAIGRRQAELIDLSKEIWAFAETALGEKRSAKILADYAEKQGFRVERGVAGMPTAFVASYGQGRPVIGILGEYDALPGLSQKAAPRKEPLQPGAAGHGCGHNLFGSASLGAASAIKELIASGKLRGTIRFYGTPAEEAIGGKAYMAREGLFNGLDAVLVWHPSDKTQADVQSTQAMVDLTVEFAGKASHAAFDPWNGRSAVDGMEAFTHGINLLREHVRPTVRMHYAIAKGGDVPNVVPEYARLSLWVRDGTRAGVETVLERVRQIGDGAALVAGVTSKISVSGGSYEILVNQAGARLLHSNLTWLGGIAYSGDEQAFARAIQRAAGVAEKGLDGSPHPLETQEAEGGSTDVGDVSWIVPTLHVSVTTAPAGAPWHAWPVVACAGMSIGHKGLVHAAKVLAATAVDLYDDAAVLEQIQAEFKEKSRGTVYKPYLPDGPPPVPTP